MAAFELRDANRHESVATEVGSDAFDPRKVREECIIALKIYDSCRSQDCLTPEELGPARAAENASFDGYCIKEGDIIDPPDNAASVTIDKLRIKRIAIADKEPNPFRNGYWDIEIKFVFEYILIFRETNGCIITKVRAKNIYNKCVTLFGSNESDTVFATDLFTSRTGNRGTIEAQPFIFAEAKAATMKRLQINQKNIPIFRKLIKNNAIPCFEIDSHCSAIPFHFINNQLHKGSLYLYVFYFINFPNIIKNGCQRQQVKLFCFFLG